MDVYEALPGERQKVAGDEDAVEEWDAMAELWESGKIQEMIESGDFSDLPDSVRPDESNETDS